MATDPVCGVFGYALKEVLRRKRKYVLEILLISLMTFMLIMLNSLSTAYKEASGLPFENIHSSIILQKNGNVPENMTGAVTPCSLAPIRYDMVNSLRGINGVKDVSSGLYLWVFDKDNFKRVLGVNWNDSIGMKIESNLIEGSLPKTDREILIDNTYAEQYVESVGGNISVSQTDFTVSGIVKTSGKDIVASDVIMNLGAAQNLAHNSVNLQKTEPFESNDVNIIFVEVEQTKISEVTNKLDELLNSTSNTGQTPTGKSIGSYNIYTPGSFENQISSLFVLSDKLTWFMSSVTFIGSLLIIIKSMSHTVMERRKEFGILKTVGFTGKDIQREFIAETFLQVCIGYILGIAATYFAILTLSFTKISISIPWELNPYPHFLTSDQSLISTVQTYFLPIKFQPSYAIMSFFIISVVGILTVIIFTKQINKLRVMEVLKYE